MPRQKKDKILKKEMCNRLAILFRDYLIDDIAECSKHLGYANSTVLRRALSGDVFLDTEKLFKLAKLETKTGASPNIHWIITGDGLPTLIHDNQCKNDDVSQRADSLVRELPIHKLKGLLALLS